MVTFSTLVLDVQVDFFYFGLTLIPLFSRSLFLNAATISKQLLVIGPFI
jgi:hypothetical protein